MTNQDQPARLDIVVAGVGGVGRAVITQLTTAASTMQDRGSAEMRIIGIADRSTLLLDADGLPEIRIGEALDVKECGDPLASLSSSESRLDLDAVRRLAEPGVAFVDTTADPGTGALWRAALDAGAAVVLANKLPLCRPWAESGGFFDHPRLRYEATVGAGLPVISTLRRLLVSGDRIIRIEASLSGTLAYLMDRVSGGVPLSAAVVEAIEAGYAEPDPREDLRGADVARKALILARTLGWEAEPEEAAPEALYPLQLDHSDLPSFLRDLAGLDPTFAARVEAEAAQGNVLRYVASIAPTTNSIRIALQAYGRSKPFAVSAGTENRIEFHTEQYGDGTLSVCGPGAGPQVTAMGVISDLLELAPVGRDEVRSWAD